MCGRRVADKTLSFLLLLFFFSSAALMGQTAEEKSSSETTKVSRQEEDSLKSTKDDSLKIIQSDIKLKAISKPYRAIPNLKGSISPPTVWKKTVVPFSQKGSSTISESQGLITENSNSQSGKKAESDKVEEKPVEKKSEPEKTEKKPVEKKTESEKQIEKVAEEKAESEEKKTEVKKQEEMPVEKKTEPAKQEKPAGKKSETKKPTEKKPESAKAEEKPAGEKVEPEKREEKSSEKKEELERQEEPAKQEVKPAEKKTKPEKQDEKPAVKKNEPEKVEEKKVEPEKKEEKPAEKKFEPEKKKEKPSEKKLEEKAVEKKLEPKKQEEKPTEKKVEPEKKEEKPTEKKEESAKQEEKEAEPKKGKEKLVEKKLEPQKQEEKPVEKEVEPAKAEEKPAEKKAEDKKEEPAKKEGKTAEKKTKPEKQEEKPAEKKVEPEKVEEKKVEPEKQEEKPAEKKAEPEKVEEKKVEPAKAEEKPVEKKAEPEKQEEKPVEKKVEPVKAEEKAAEKKAESEKQEDKPAEKKAEPQKKAESEEKKVEPTKKEEKPAAKKADPAKTKEKPVEKKAEPEKVEEKPAEKKAEPAKQEEKPAEKKTKPEKTEEPKKASEKKAETKKIEEKPVEKKEEKPEKKEEKSSAKKIDPEKGKEKSADKKEEPKKKEEKKPADSKKEKPAEDKEGKQEEDSKEGEEGAEEEKGEEEKPAEEEKKEEEPPPPPLDPMYVPKEVVKDMSAQITAAFAKDGAEIEPGSMFFNVFKLKNNSSENMELSLNFDIPYPRRTKVILQPTDAKPFVLEAGKSKFIPIRVGFPSDVEGGKEHLVKVSLFSEKHGGNIVPYVSATVTVKAVSKWKMWAPSTKAISNSEDESFTAVIVRMLNEGNVMEKLDFKAKGGDLIVVEDGKKGLLQKTINLRPRLDTTLRVYARCQAYDPAENQGDKVKLLITAQGPLDTIPKELIIGFESMSSGFKNRIKEEESPLIFSINQSNLGTKESATSINLSGNILLKNDRAFSYSYGFQDNFFGGGDGASIGEKYIKKASFSLGYTDKKNSLKFGQVGGGMTTSTSGLGISYKRALEDGAFDLTLAKKKENGGFGVATSFDKTLSENFKAKAGVTVDLDKKAGTMTVAPGLATSFLLANRHNFSVSTGISHQKMINSPTPKQKSGVGYALNYGMKYNNLAIAAKSVYGSKDYLGGNAGLFRNEVTAGLKMGTSTLKVKVVNSQKKNDKMDDDDRVISKGKTVSNRFGASYSFKIGNMPFATGADFDNSSTVVNIKGDISSYTNQAMRFRLGTGFKLAKLGVALAPSINVGLNRSKRSNSANSGEGAMYGPPELNLESGLNGSFKDGGFSLGYKRKAMAPGKEGDETAYSQSLNFGINRSWALMEEKLGLNVSADADYQVEEKQLKTSVNAKLEYETEDGWKFTMSAAIDPNKIASGDPSGAVNVNASARKALDMNQPRLKYYNLKMVFFKDYDGNRELDKKDEGISNVLGIAERSKDPVLTEEGMQTVKFESPPLISNGEGIIKFAKIPMGYYIVGIEELFEPMQFMNLEGTEYEVNMQGHTTLYVPYCKSITIVGKTKITRDQYSRVVGVTPKNIRVTVKDANGQVYHTLTDHQGNYTISVPLTQSYTVSMKNVLGSKFNLEGAEQELKFEEGTMRYEINFHYKEKGRGINFG